MNSCFATIAVSTGMFRLKLCLGSPLVTSLQAIGTSSNETILARAPTNSFLPTIVVRPAAYGEANSFCSAFETDRHAGLHSTESMCHKRSSTKARSSNCVPPLS
jgi:hypothetical protein